MFHLFLLGLDMMMWTDQSNPVSWYQLASKSCFKFILLENGKDGPSHFFVQASMVTLQFHTITSPLFQGATTQDTVLMQIHCSQFGTGRMWP
jgi:hypothetical protein